jgi:hypothetical protein
MIQNLFQFQTLVDIKKNDDDSVSSADSYNSEENDQKKLLNPTKKLLKIDGTIALKMQDAAGDTPLHLAAKHHASLAMLEFLMKNDAEVAMFPNNKGDLPLHLLLDKNFLFVNADVANAHGAKDSKQNVFDFQHTPVFRDKVRELAKKQTVVVRLQKYRLCGAIFAPTNGWTSENDEDVLQKRFDTIKKINLLGTAVLKLQQSAMCFGSGHGLNCLQILIAFHAAPYKVIKDILMRYPECAHGKSLKDGYSALDIHCIRRSIPNEVRKEEIEVSIIHVLISFVMKNVNDWTDTFFPYIFFISRGKQSRNFSSAMPFSPSRQQLVAPVAQFSIAVKTRSSLILSNNKFLPNFLVIFRSLTMHKETILLTQYMRY